MTSAHVIPLFLIGVAMALAAPNPPEHVVFKPTFLTGYDSFTAGTGFVPTSLGHRPIAPAAARAYRDVNVLPA